MQLIETQFSARLRLGDAGDVIGELEAAVATYPYQEGLWELLITALYRAGRQADALATYQRVRTRLADELGLDPGPRLQQLEQQILNHDPALRGPDRAAPGTCRRCRPSWSDARRRSPRSPTCCTSRAARRDRRAGRDRQDGGRDRDRSTAVRVARRRLAGQAREPRRRRRRPRHGDRRAERHGRRGGAVRAAQGRRRGGDPRQLRARRRRGRGARGPAARRRPRAADPVHQPGPARRRRRGACSSSRRSRSPTRWSCSPVAPLPGAGIERPRADDAVRRPVPLARRPAAGDRARRGANQDAVDRGDHPPPRRSLQRA